MTPSRKLTQAEADALASAIAHWKELKAGNPEHEPTAKQCALCKLNPGTCKTCILWQHAYGVMDDDCIPQFYAAYEAITHEYDNKEIFCQCMITLLEEIQNTYEVEDESE